MKRGEVDLAGRVVVVTGAAHGIGRAVANGMAAAGARVCLADIDEQRISATVAEIEAAGGECLPVSMDVTDLGSVEAAARQAVGRWGRIDSLVNCAAVVLRGVDTPRQEWDAWDDSTWDEFFRVNSRGAWTVCRGIVPSMPESGGSIVLFSSQAVGLPPGLLAPYIASKASLVGLIRSLAVELGPRSVTVNGIAPGLIRTERVQETLTEDYAEDQRLRTALGRLGEPDDLVGPSIFFSSSLSRFVTGQVMIVDGGMVYAL